MAKIKITTLTPIHISSGNEYEENFNMLIDENRVYIYDEFKIAQFLIDNNIEISSNLNDLKNSIKRVKNQIIKADIHKRVIESQFNLTNKILLEQISTANRPIIPGSSIKGAIKTAYVYKMVKNGEFKNEQEKLQQIDDEIYNANSNIKKDLNIRKKNVIRDINKKIDKKIKDVSKYLKISDTLETVETNIYKTINIKKDRNHQESRKSKIEQIANFVEGIKQNQTSFIIIDIKNAYFKDFIRVCNDFYHDHFKNDFSYYFSEQINDISLNKNSFLLNVGRFSGAEIKSIEEIRSLAKTGADVTWETSARTYALEKPTCNEPFFDNELLPFGWVLCEIVEY